MKILNRSVEKSNIWIKDAQKALKWDDPHKSYTALRSVLHALRDRLTNKEAVQLGAQLPTFIRGAYYEGWKLPSLPVRDRARYGFLSAIEKPFGKDKVTSIDTVHVARSIFRFLNEKISEGEIDDIRAILPKPLAEFWPDRDKSAAGRKALPVGKLKPVRSRLEPTVHDLFHAASKSHRAVMGLARTLQSLNEGRARKLLYHAEAPLQGFVCSACATMFAADRESCTVCGSPLLAVPNVFSQIVEFARERKIPIHAIAGSDGRLLTRSGGGIGAFVRTARAALPGLA